MSARGPRALLYVTADPAGAPRVVAAIERGANGGLWFVPDPGRIADHDPRGRRTTLGALLSAHGADHVEDLIDVAAHLVPLPRLDPVQVPTAEVDRREQPELGLRWVGFEGLELDPTWPAPGGTRLLLRPAPMRLARGRTGALLASRAAPGGPWMRPCGPVTAEVQALLELLAEIGVPLVQQRSWIERWLDAVAAGAPTLGERRDVLLEGFRGLVREALLRGAAAPLEIDGTRLAVRADPAPEHIRWRFELHSDEFDAASELESARFSTDAVADLLAVLDAPQQPYWLLLFETRPELGQVFAGVVDVRRYLSEHLEALEDTVEADR